MADEPLVDNKLLANFVHQVISPLNGVLGTLDNLVDGTISVDKERQRLKSVRAQLVHAIELVRNLAYLSTLSAKVGHRGVSEKAVDVILPEVIIQAAQFFQEAALQRHVDIHLENWKTQYSVKGHPHLLRQVFMNLFDNGTKYSDPHSQVTVDIHVQKSTGHLIAEVKSTGIGFDFDERERIFEPGVRGKDSGALRASGSGLGLYVCRRILEDAHDASIEAEHSRQTRATCFRLRFKSFEIARKPWSRRS